MQIILEAIEAFKKLNSDICVVKAQVHSGARGKAGGIVVCKSDEEVKSASDKLFELISRQYKLETKENL